MRVKVLITGVSGMIGSALAAALRERGDIPIGVSRSGKGSFGWDPERGVLDSGALDGVDAVVHLAGRRIFPPFTAGRRKAILDSRVDGTRLIADAVAQYRPAVFISGSAIGYYGSRGDEELTESSAPGTGFLAEVTVAWEAAAQAAIDAGVRTVFLRSGLVLHRSGGLLPLLSIPVKLGLAGPIGGGRQWWSWTSLEDEVRAILHCIDGDLSGPVNVAAPGVVRNRVFFETLAKHLRRPAILPLPAFAIRFILGRTAADDLVLTSQKVSSQALADSGFEFSHPSLAEALAAG